LGLKMWAVYTCMNAKVVPHADLPCSSVPSPEREPMA
jgi:hypothetical protein